MGSRLHADHWISLFLERPYAEGVIWTTAAAAQARYALWAYIPEADGSGGNVARDAIYKISHADGTEKIHLDQSATSEDWAYMGRFEFTSGSDQWVRLGDSYDDSAEIGRWLLLDALRVRPTTDCDCDTAGAVEQDDCDDGTTRTRACDGCTWSAWPDCPEEATPDSGGTIPADSGTTSGGFTDDPRDGDPRAQDTPAGCGCGATQINPERVAQGRGASGWAALLLLGVVRRRRVGGAAPSG